MCGIAGIIGFKGTDLKDRVQRMSAPIRHRGPDDKGIYLAQDIGLGFAHRRLSILDVSSAGAQPMESPDGDLVIVYNGEVYNYLEIKAELEQKSHVFRTGTDTEVILAAYREWGRDCLEKFNGMWAFALYDLREHQVFLARDRLGIKPLYYYHDGDRGFYFASEIKSIVEGAPVEFDLDVVRMDSYMDFGYVPGEKTLFKGVHRLLPGHSLMVDLKGKGSPISYWDLNFETSPGDLGLDTYVAQGRELLNSAIDLRLRSDVPLGIFLSGGLDSSSVVGLLAPRVSTPLKTFSVAYDFGKSFNETPHARLVARRFKTDHHEFFVTQEAFKDFIPDFVRFMDEPVTEAAAISLYFISKLAKEHVTVVLSGEGSDEIFAGYDFYRYMRILDVWHRAVGHRMGHGISKMADAFLPQGNKLRKYLSLGSLSMEERYKGISTYDDGIKKFLYQRDFLHHVLNSGPEARNHSYKRALFDKSRDWNALNRMLFFDTKTWLVDDLLIKADRMSMAASQELRVPFLDYRLVEFAARLPVRYKIKGGSGKYLLKEMMAGVLPPQIIHRKKMGFPTPLKLMFQQKLADHAREVLTDASCRLHRYFNGDFMAQLVQEHIEKKQDHHRVIWQLMVLEIWMQTWMKN